MAASPVLHHLQTPHARVVWLCRLQTQLLQQKACLQRLVDNAASMDSELRLNSTWLLQSLTYRASMEIKRDAMCRLTWPVLNALLHDVELNIQVGAARFVAGSLCGAQSSASVDAEAAASLITGYQGPPSNRGCNAAGGGRWRLGVGAAGWRQASVARLLL
jgi:hypothetical protein